MSEKKINSFADNFEERRADEELGKFLFEAKKLLKKERLDTKVPRKIYHIDFESRELISVTEDGLMSLADKRRF